MTAQPSVRSADWFRDPRLQRLIRTISGTDEEARIVGGAVRNTLLGAPVADVDLATTALPRTVVDRTRAAGMKPIPTGIDHGTVTVVVDSHPFEVTTLRRDLETDGRRATVAFGRDWSTDAHRRDFTINALYADADGRIIDVVGGVEDCQARRVRFIGRAEDRIAEDYLRILRFFRFHAAYGHGAPDAEGLAASAALRDGLTELSAERIGHEMLKLLPAPGAPDALDHMQATGILALIFGSDADLGHARRLHHLLSQFASLPTAAAAPLILAAMIASERGDDGDIARKWRLPNSLRDRIARARMACTELTAISDDRNIRAMIYRHGPDVTRDALLLAHSRSAGSGDPAALIGQLQLIADFPRPHLPISGKDLLARGIAAGPPIGAWIEDLDARFIASDFSLTRQELLAFLPPAPPGAG